jgi:hypothetical protein
VRRDEVEFEGRYEGTSLAGTFSMACDNAMGEWSVERTSPPLG